LSNDYTRTIARNQRFARVYAVAVARAGVENRRDDIAL
jgi:hypothetical protein